jgi:hypothetical protein
VDADGDGEIDDRDEVPMVFTRRGSRRAPNGDSASHIAYVDTSDNRGAAARSAAGCGAIATAPASGSGWSGAAGAPP